MERFDLSEEPRLSDVVAAAERGEEVVIVRDGAVVAEVRVKPPMGLSFQPDLQGTPKAIDLAAFDALHLRFPELRIDSAANLLREMRDMDD